MAKVCKYCNIQQLEGYDELERKYFEKGTKTYHTRERCEALKNSGGGGGDAQIYTKPVGNTGAAGSYALELRDIKSKLDNLESKIDQALAKIRGQDTLDREEDREGSD